MGGRDTQITVYVTDERKAELKQRAEEEDTSMSGIINDMIDRQLQQDAQDAIASEARAEERIQELISVGTEQMVETAKEIRDMNAKFGAYTIANFELMKQDRSAHVRKDALDTGARRIRQDLETGIQEVGEDTSATEASAETTTDSTTTQRPTSDAPDSPDTATDDTPDDVDETTDGSDDAESDADDGSDLFTKLRSDRE
ncbi:hypothetical protein [Halogeometricum luteum]|uniref:Ribbon-helix-helix protein, copG family n=1 Tax=Halogeometricum luteum TaxID=2950537 RepID=A0ABU2G8A2_9EURY|nr:hypothetical protein [Halogeometricum sp. S3BR5-2]MDS0297046.1 hypothetical protein [Halogeometricum sp. S3BR5-2]